MWLCRPRAPDPAASRISDAHSSCRRLQARATPGLGRAWAEVCMGEKLGGVAGAWRGARPWKVAHLIGRSGGGRREERAARPWLGAGDWALVSIRVVSIRVVSIRVVSIRVATPRLTGAKAGRHEAPAQCTARVYLSAQGERAPWLSLSARPLRASFPVRGGQRRQTKQPAVCLGRQTGGRVAWAAPASF